MSWRGVVGLAILIAAAAASWLLVTGEREPAPDAAAQSPFQAGYYLLDARWIGMAEDGSRLYSIEAREVVETEVPDEVLMNDVRIEYSPEAEVPWTLTADRALLERASRRVRLEGNVHAVSGAGEPGERAELLTEYLELEPETYAAETDRRVTLRVGNRTLTATGMLALLQDDRLELKSNVSGRFVP